MSSTARIILNFVGFQGSWVGAIMLAAANKPWLGVACIAANIAIQLALSPQHRRDLFILAPGIIVGPLVDCLLVTLGLFTFTPAPGITPIFLAFFAAMWANFGTTLPVSMMFLVRRPLLALPLGAGGGVLAYLAADRLNAITIADGVWPLAAIAAEFGILTTAWCFYAARVMRGTLDLTPALPPRSAETPGGAG